MLQREPIAIIGIGCRYPGGAHGPDAFWRLLRDGVDAITAIPADRWKTEAFYDPTPGQKGKTVARRGGFVEGIDQFDAAFFGLSPREAAFMDPQQRLLLQAAWEAIDDGGAAISLESGAPVGVFVGVSTNDYSLLQSTIGDLSTIDPYTATGTATSIVANRISYCLNLRGPSVVVDTACSSSLVALHLACTSLRNGECALALAGGVNVIIGVSPFISFSRSSMLSPDGHCKAFDASANGFVRGEGAGVVALKPLRAALADGNPIYAVIRATAVNQDGRTNGITVPNGAAQAALVRDTCAAAGISPGAVHYVEAHGTGTSVGDPIEAQALGAALGAERNGRACVIGSVKTNIGHLEAGAGIAGVIKVALSLHYGQIPPSLHFKHPNPHIDFEKWKLRVAQTLEPYPNGVETPTAGVNSFGFGGTNAHAILQAAPIGARRRPDRPAVTPARAVLLPLAARSADALRALATEYQAFLGSEGAGRGAELDDICFTAGAHRSQHPHRLCAVGVSRESLIEQLGAYLAGETRTGLTIGEPVVDAAPVFVCSGQGPQWWAMGRELLQTEPVFREAITECDALLREWADWSLLEELTRDEASTRLNETAIAQPAIFALQVALAALWRAWGIQPAAVVGHSVGETAAAYIAGALSLREAARVIFHRGACMEVASGQGRMLAAALTWEQAVEAIADFQDRVSIGAHNAPQSVTLSGDAKALETIAARLSEREVTNTFLRVNYAFHSQQMEPVREELLRGLGEVDVQAATVPLFSTVTGGAATAEDFRADYWWRNVRQSVRFATAIDALIQSGHRRFLELSPHPVLSGPVLECLRQREIKGTVVSSLRRKEPERAAMLGALGVLHTIGCPVNWRTVYPEARAVRLPVYPWQQERFWNESEESSTARLNPTVHPLLGNAIKTADPTWQARLDLDVLAYLKDHRIQGRAVFPAAGYVEMALGASRILSGVTPCVIEDLDFLKALSLPEGEDAVRVQFAHQLADAAFTISSRPAGEGQAWVVHATGRLRVSAETAPRSAASLAELQQAFREEVPVEGFYQHFRDVGIAYGPVFRGAEALWRTDGAALGRVRLPAAAEADGAKYELHPGLLDACFQVMVAAIPPSARDGRRVYYLPVQIARLRFFARPGNVVWTHARLVRVGDRNITGDLRLFDEDGRTLLQIEGLAAQVMTQLRSGGTDDLSDALYKTSWRLQPLETPAATHVAGVDAPLPATTTIVARMEKLALALGRSVEGGANLRAAEPAIEELCQLYITDAFEQLGWRMRRGEQVTLDGLVARLGIAPRHRQLFARFFKFLQEDGLLKKSGDGWKVLRAARKSDTELLWRRILERCPRVLPEIAMIRRCGRELAGVLQDRVDPLKLIFPDGSLAAAEHLYQDGDSFRSSNRLVGEAVAACVAKLPEGRKIRILEIGAGTGGMSAFVLPHLPRDRTEFVFTDLSNAFFVKAEQKFFDYPFIQYRLLDIDKPPAEQGFAPQTFDLVLASDAIHASRDLRKTLSHVRSLLAPRGLLVLLESDIPARWPDLVFGLTDGWWHFADGELRGGYPLLERHRWLELFSACGFDGAWAVSDQGDKVRSRQSIFIAREPRAERGADALAPGGAARSESSGAWLVLADRSGLSEKLTARLADRGDRPIRVFSGKNFRRLGADAFELGPDAPDDMRCLLSEMRADGVARLFGVVHAWSLDATTRSLANAEVLGSHSAMHLVQALTEDAAAELPRMFIVTRGAQAVEHADPVAVAQAPIWGLGRVLCSERPKFRTRLIDLAPEAAAGEEEMLLRELDATDGEDEVAYRGAARYVARLAHTAIEHQVRPAKVARRHAGYRLEVPNPGALDRLVLRARRRTAPGAGEVEIAVKAAALNFRDVLKTLGIYPTEDDRDSMLGDECSGRIVAVGRGVKHLRPGDDVIVLARGCFASHITTEATRVMPKPAGLYFDEAATIPVAFLTAWYALQHLGRIQRGERVLIQAATGGVGMAAIQVARLAGAEIFATAGSAEKRELLRALGIRHVMDSRSLAFADEVRELTNGRGVDLVLNSLSGEAIAKGVACLAPNGRFLEIGKRDVYQNAKLGLRPFRNNIAFFVIDLAQIIENDPRLVATMLRRIMVHVAAGRFRPLPLRTFQVSQAVNAFRHMSQARHIGKIVLDLEHDPAATVAVVDSRPMHFKADATYLITGGFGGFGQAVAEWMLRHGARHLVLASRRGGDSDEARQTLAKLQALGGEVVAVKADIANPRDVARVLRTISSRMPPLHGIMHTAMVIDDGVLSQLDAGRFRAVMAPKADGAWNLHNQTAGLPLDFFVLFSSISAIVGSAGQGNYAAANCFLEALAHHRRAQGQPALVVSWGAISDVGYVARNGRVEEYLRHLGLIGIKPAEATQLLGRLLRNDATHMGVFPVDWQKWAAKTPAAAGSRRFSEVITATTTEPTAETGGSREAILGLPPGERLAALTTQLKSLIAKVLRTPVTRLDAQRPLQELGLDSLMSIELLERIEGHFGTTLRAGNLTAGSTIAKMATDLLVVLGGAPSPVAAEAAKPAAAALEPVDCLVVLRAGGALAPLFCIHPAGGLANIYEPLARRLACDRPIIAIQSRTLKSGAPEHESLAALAGEYARLIRARQPQGPYHLLGFSIGGLFTLAVAHALESAGQAIAFVALIDANARLTDPQYLRSTFLRPFIATMYGTLARETPILKPLSPAELNGVAARLASALVEMDDHAWPAAIARSLGEHDQVLPRLPAGLLTQYLSLFCAHARLIRHFEIPVLNAPLAVWFVDEASRAASGWSGHTRSSVVESIIAGEHYDLLYPPLVDALAAQLTDAIACAGKT